MIEYKHDGFEVTVVADTIHDGVRITSMQLRYPRFILAELNTHRQFSRSSSSSRAIPVSKVIKQVFKDAAKPVHWGANQAGMQAHTELTGLRSLLAKGLWSTAGYFAASVAWCLTKVGLHKQVANRLLEPFQWTHTIVTSTEWDNFYELRAHGDAQPEIQKLARMMQHVHLLSEPKQSIYHLPYITEDDRQQWVGMDEAIAYKELAKVSTARCARVSYTNHQGKVPSVTEDLKLYDRLVGMEPIHASPAEHQARYTKDEYVTSNLRDGWLQFRKEL